MLFLGAFAFLRSQLWVFCQLLEEPGASHGGGLESA